MIDENSGDKHRDDLATLNVIKAALKRTTPMSEEDVEEFLLATPTWLEHLIARVEKLEAKLERTKEHWRRQREETEMIEQSVYDELDEENKELRTKLNVAMEFLKMHLDKQTLPPELASEYLASRKEPSGWNERLAKLKELEVHREECNNIVCQKCRLLSDIERICGEPSDE